MSSPSKMTPRQWWLYRYLLERAGEDPAAWVSQREVCEALAADPSYKGEGYAWAADPHTHDRCVGIWRDVTAINASPEVDKPILVKSHSYKLPTSLEEAEDGYLEAARMRAVRAFKRYLAAYRKCAADGQGKLISNQGKEIAADSAAKRFVEAFAGEAPSDD